VRLTLWTDYALRTLIYVGTKEAATPGNAGLSTIAEIARSYAISRTHLMKVVNQLSQLGLLEATRGKGGGLRLARPAAEIGVGDVVRSMEKEHEVVGCLRRSGFCRIERCCVLKQTLQAATRAFLQTLDRYTLADLLQPRSRLLRAFDLPQGTASP